MIWQHAFMTSPENSPINMQRGNSCSYMNFTVHILSYTIHADGRMFHCREHTVVGGNCVSLVCCRSPGVLFLPISKMFALPFLAEMAHQSPYRTGVLFCLIDMSKCAIIFIGFQSVPLLTCKHTQFQMESAQLMCALNRGIMH